MLRSTHSFLCCAAVAQQCRRHRAAQPQQPRAAGSSRAAQVTSRSSRVTSQHTPTHAPSPLLPRPSSSLGGCVRVLLADDARRDKGWQEVAPLAPQRLCPRLGLRRLQNPGQEVPHLLSARLWPGESPRVLQELGQRCVRVLTCKRKRAIVWSVCGRCVCVVWR
eukprot:289552-Rhodomonas_salina.1